MKNEEREHNFFWVRSHERTHTMHTKRVRVNFEREMNATCHQPGFNLEIVSFFYQLTPASTTTRAHNTTPNYEWGVGCGKKNVLDDGDESERTSKRRVGSGAVEISAPNEAGVVIPCASPHNRRITRGNFSFKDLPPHTHTLSDVVAVASHSPDAPRITQTSSPIKTCTLVPQNIYDDRSTKRNECPRRIGVRSRLYLPRMTFGFDPTQKNRRWCAYNNNTSLHPPSTLTGSFTAPPLRVWKG